MTAHLGSAHHRRHSPRARRSSVEARLARTSVRRRPTILPRLQPPLGIIHPPRRRPTRRLRRTTHLPVRGTARLHPISTVGQHPLRSLRSRRATRPHLQRHTHRPVPHSGLQAHNNLLRALNTPLPLVHMNWILYEMVYTNFIHSLLNGLLRLLVLVAGLLSSMFAPRFRDHGPQLMSCLLALLRRRRTTNCFRLRTCSRACFL